MSVLLISHAVHLDSASIACSFVGASTSNIAQGFAAVVNFGDRKNTGIDSRVIGLDHSAAAAWPVEVIEWNATSGFGTTWT